MAEFNDAERALRRDGYKSGRMIDLAAMRLQLPERVTLLISLVVGVGCHKSRR
jgi:hypothetical protein